MYYPDNYTCCCACPRCVMGDCCRNNYYPTYYPYYPPQPYVPWVYPTGTNVTTTATVSVKTFTCPKCHESAFTRWHETDDSCQRGQEGDWGSGEHLHYTCKSCQYHWAGPVK